MMKYTKRDRLKPLRKCKKLIGIMQLVTMLLLLPTSTVFAQVGETKTVSGIIVSKADNEPLIGVAVQLKGTTVGIVTDIDGKYSLKIADANMQSGLLEFTYLGYVTQRVEIKGNTTINIVMEEDPKKLDEVVVVGYGVQKRVNMTGSVSAIKADEIKTMSVANISNAIGGKVSGLVTKQTSGEPGNDASTLYLRGNSNPLVLVDGIVSEYNKVNMAEVESVTLLKDASAVAPYGMAGANGVILITTKRGQSRAGKVTVSYNGEFGWQKPTNTPEFMSAADGLRLKKLAYQMDGKQAQADAITDEMLAAYEQGTDAYPNTDWAKNYMNSSTSQKHGVTLSGGNDVVKAYVSLGYMNQGSMYGDNQDYTRYNFRSNFDFKLTKTTTFSTDLSLINDEKRSNNASSSDIMLNIYRARATEADVYSNGLPAFQSSIGSSLYQTVNGAGTQSGKNNYQQVSLSVNQELPFVKGLSVKALFNVNRTEYNSKVWKVPYKYYTYDAANDVYTESTTSYEAQLTKAYNLGTRYTAQGYLNYKNQFDKHGISGLVVYERQWGTSANTSASRSNYDVLIPEIDKGSSDYQYSNGTSSETAQDGVVLRVNYDYAQKYLLEFAGRYDRFYVYAPGHRGAFFPSASIGWRISEEPFLQNISILDNLKLRASYGKSGNAVGNPYQWSTNYGVTTGYIWGSGGNSTQQQGLAESVEANPSITWESVWKSNLGIDLSLWNGLFGLELDVFREYRKDKLLTPSATVPIEYGIGLAQVNGGKEERYGVDFTLSNHTRINKSLSFDNLFVFGFSRDKQIELFEAPGTYNIPQFRRTGYSSSQLRGYIAEGLFADEEEIKNWAYQTSSTLPGDIKYKDLNGDGKIDSNDQTIIGRTRIPEIMYGYTLALNYRNFDAKIFFQGTGNSSFYLGQDASGSSDRGVRYPFDNDKPRVDHINSWTTENPDPNAKYPRLSTTKNEWNYLTSSFWVVNTAYLKLKSLELGYNLAPQITRKVSMDNVRFYFNLYNLWTLYSKMPKDFDVENQNYNAYPQQFIASLGVNITF
ncbi:MAG: SusC/RagA family TonB-linked outer membrane protein [Dysgonomonas sp.]